jgi:hypothetical protein
MPLASILYGIVAMTDHVLTEREVEQLESLNETMLNGLPKVDAFALIDSHRLLHQRHRSLLRQVVELERASND